MQRNIDLDITKGILIFLVVLGHSGIENSNIIYWFHMPAFFFISGFLFDTNKLVKANYTNFILKKILNLIIPYSSYLFLITLISWLFHVGSMNVTDEYFPIKAIWGGVFLSGQFGTFWFIPTLLFTILAYSIIYRFVKSEIYRLILISTLFLLGHLESLLIYSYGYNIIFPLNLDVCLITLGYYYFGTIIKRQISTSHNYTGKIQYKKYLFLTFFVLSILIIIFSFQYKMDLKYKLYSNPLFTFFVPIIFTAVIIFVAGILKKSKIFSFFEILGRHSLSIMFLHLTLKDFLYKYNNYNIWLFSIFGCLLPVLVSYIFNYYKITRLLFTGSIQEYDTFKKLNT